MRCGRTWDEYGFIQIKQLRFFITIEFICEQCTQRNEVYREECEDLEEIEKAKNGGVIDWSNYVCDL